MVSGLIFFLSVATAVYFQQGKGKFGGLWIRFLLINDDTKKKHNGAIKNSTLYVCGVLIYIKRPVGLVLQNCAAFTIALWHFFYNHYQNENILLAFITGYEYIKPLFANTSYFIT